MGCAGEAVAGGIRGHRGRESGAEGGLWGHAANHSISVEGRGSVTTTKARDVGRSMIDRGVEEW
jgi:hypothetical protein